MNQTSLEAISPLSNGTFLDGIHEHVMQGMNQLLGTAMSLHPYVLPFDPSAPVSNTPPSTPPRQLPYRQSEACSTEKMDRLRARLYGMSYQDFLLLSVDEILQKEQESVFSLPGQALDFPEACHRLTAKTAKRTKRPREPRVPPYPDLHKQQRKRQGKTSVPVVYDLTEDSPGPMALPSLSTTTPKVTSSSSEGWLGPLWLDHPTICASSQSLPQPPGGPISRDTSTSDRMQELPEQSQHSSATFLDDPLPFWLHVDPPTRTRDTAASQQATEDSILMPGSPSRSMACTPHLLESRAGAVILRLWPQLCGQVSLEEICSRRIQCPSCGTSEVSLLLDCFINPAGLPRHPSAGIMERQARARAWRLIESSLMPMPRTELANGGASSMVSRQCSSMTTARPCASSRFCSACLTDTL